MTVNDDILYIGTEGGALLSVSCLTWEVQFIFHVYSGPVRCLIIATSDLHPRVFTELFSWEEPVTTSEETASINPINLAKMKSLSLPKFTESLSSQHSVLISLGMEYTGVVRDSKNCPTKFSLPGKGNKENKQDTKPAPTDGYLLLWKLECTHSETRENQ